MKEFATYKHVSQNRKKEQTLLILDSCVDGIIRIIYM
jgi:hypothetical protein